MRIKKLSPKEEIERELKSYDDFFKSNFYKEYEEYLNKFETQEEKDKFINFVLSIWWMGKEN